MKAGDKMVMVNLATRNLKGLYTDVIVQAVPGPDTNGKAIVMKDGDRAMRWCVDPSFLKLR